MKGRTIRRSGFTSMKQLKTKRFLISFHSIRNDIIVCFWGGESSGAQGAPLLSPSYTH